MEQGHACSESPLRSHSCSGLRLQNTHSEMKRLRFSKTATAEPLTKHGAFQSTRPCVAQEASPAKGSKFAHPPDYTSSHRTTFFCQSPRGPVQACQGPPPEADQSHYPSLASLAHGPKLLLPEPICSPASPPQARNLPPLPCCSRSVRPWVGTSTL